MRLSGYALTSFALTSCATSQPLHVGYPSAKQVRQAVNLEHYLDVIGSVDCSAGVNCYTQNAVGTVRTRNVQCKNIATEQAQCAYEVDYCSTYEDADKNGWCSRTAELKFQSLLDGKRGWKITSSQLN